MSLREREIDRQRKRQSMVILENQVKHEDGLKNY